MFKEESNQPYNLPLFYGPMKIDQIGKCGQFFLLTANKQDQAKIDTIGGPWFDHISCDLIGRLALLYLIYCSVFKLIAYATAVIEMSIPEAQRFRGTRSRQRHQGQQLLSRQSHSAQNFRRLSDVLVLAFSLPHNADPAVSTHSRSLDGRSELPRFHFQLHETP